MTDATLVRIQDSLIGGAVNGVINGAIAYFTFKGHSAVPLTMDLISSKQHTVWGQGVSLAFALGIILSLITARMFVKHVAKTDAALAARLQRPMGSLVKVALGNAMALFGWFVALAVLWQRVFGSIEVGPVSATILVGLLAAIITVIVEVRTKRSLLQST
jgi:hypothetical protein